MRGREGKGPPSTDLLVCFPTRAHLSLMPKPICSPARPSDSSSSRPRHQRRPSHHLRRPGPSSPAAWARAKSSNNDDKDNNSEPTSPKVTCAGQIKVRTKPNTCKNWQSVMEEIERMHNHRKHKKRAPWAEALGFKKEVMHFLTCLRNIRFDFRCFGSIPAAEISSDDDDDDEEDDAGAGTGEAVFSKWFMILQENNDPSKEEKNYTAAPEEEEEAPAPPANALLLMRCRSAPAKSWLEEREEEEERERERREKGEGLIENDGKRKEEADFCEFAVEIAKETWMEDRICRSRSWKR